jgi:hypothetical protein
LSSWVPISWWKFREQIAHLAHLGPAYVIASLMLLPPAVLLPFQATICGEGTSRRYPRCYRKLFHVSAKSDLGSQEAYEVGKADRRYPVSIASNMLDHVEIKSTSDRSHTSHRVFHLLSAAVACRARKTALWLVCESTSLSSRRIGGSRVARTHAPESSETLARYETISQF